MRRKTSIHVTKLWITPPRQGRARSKEHMAPANRNPVPFPFVPEAHSHHILPHNLAVGTIPFCMSREGA
ncbi:hypothetical protein L195_g041564 [Trifolium pratense]|uniref:Uncharacterized protein n=1 Tax=Trifolium pratense TaxID=57577 RepID=A0A2K3M3X7_TRIPR|nr:hypothetical protein L195_g041564 [Trifolium pratense]